MQYIVIDLEWNQAKNSNDPILLTLPTKLNGEIIQIGAVRLSKDIKLLDEFKANVKPVYFRSMNQRVEQLTGINAQSLNRGLGFREAMRALKKWCAEPSLFLTWGCDDKKIMLQNLILHKLERRWINRWVNLQTVYNMYVKDDKQQASLKDAMDYFNIKQTRTAHDALGDAFNTALICTKLSQLSSTKQFMMDVKRLI